MKTTDQILADALDMLNTVGHCKDQLQDGEGRVCAVGALNYATTGSHFHGSLAMGAEQNAEYLQAYGRILDAANHDKPQWWSIPDFNDDPRITAEDVKLVFKMALEHGE